jgi:hypothetical protein
MLWSPPQLAIFNPPTESKALSFSLSKEKERNKS